jgi:hypothetical protein
MGLRCLSTTDRVFDLEPDLDGIPEATAAMDEHSAVESLVRVGTV